MEGMTLTQAISGVENAAAALGTADSAQQAATERFVAAEAAKTSADAADAIAVSDFNGALDTLIAAATAAKVIR